MILFHAKVNNNQKIRSDTLKKILMKCKNVACVKSFGYIILVMGILTLSIATELEALEIDKIKKQPAIDPQTIASTSDTAVPYNVPSFTTIRVQEVWRKYDAVLSWGKGQTLAILDDGCDLTVPQWQAKLAWGKKVIAGYNSFDDNNDPTPVPPGYHGTTVGYPSSLNYNGVHGIAYNNYVAQVRCVTIVHLPGYESRTMARALQWVIDNHEKYNITAINLSPLDDKEHRVPVPTEIDPKLRKLRALNIWVSAPTGNNEHTSGISWPACQPDCFAVGATLPEKHKVIRDRFNNTDLLVAAVATSSSNAYAAASFQIMREAIEKTGFNWKQYGPTMPEAVMHIFQKTGAAVHDPVTGIDFKELDLLAAVDYIFGHSSGDDR